MPDRFAASSSIHTRGSKTTDRIITSHVTLPATVGTVFLRTGELRADRLVLWTLQKQQTQASSCMYLKLRPEYLTCQRPHWIKRATPFLILAITAAWADYRVREWRRHINDTDSLVTARAVIIILKRREKKTEPRHVLTFMRGQSLWLNSQVTWALFSWQIF